MQAAVDPHGNPEQQGQDGGHEDEFQGRRQAVCQDNVDRLANAVGDAEVALRRVDDEFGELDGDRVV